MGENTPFSKWLFSSLFFYLLLGNIRTGMKVANKHHDFFKLYDRFVKETLKGKRLQKNGKRVRPSSMEPYIWLRKALNDFSVKKSFRYTFRL
ncbi:MAG: hypothetical protein ACT4ON_01540 [Bacteroidota bacterium]